MNEVDLMSPSKVAEKYGGDKRKIAQAVQMGMIDPTVGVMAGMFIDRMRSAAAQEQQPQTTVAQDVMTQPQAGIPAAAAAPMERGLAALPVDESMIPSGEGYAGGGIIAFDVGGRVPRYDELPLAPKNLRAGDGFTYESSLPGLSTTEYRIDPFTGMPVTLGDYLRALDERGLRTSAAQAPVSSSAPVSSTAPVPSSPISAEYPDESKRGTAAGIVKQGAATTAAPRDEQNIAPQAALIRRSSIAPASFEEALGKAKAALGDLPKEDVYADIRAELEARKGKADENLKQAAWMRLAEAGFNMAAGTSPYALQNVAKAGVQAIKSYGEDLKDQEKLSREDRKMLADIKKLEQADAKNDIFKTTDLAYRILNEANEDVRARVQAETMLSVEGSRAATARESTQLTRALTLANTAEQNKRTSLAKQSEDPRSPVYKALKTNPNYIEEQAAAARNRILRDYGLSLPSMTEESSSAGRTVDFNSLPK